METDRNKVRTDLENFRMLHLFDGMLIRDIESLILHRIQRDLLLLPKFINDEIFGDAVDKSAQVHDGFLLHDHCPHFAECLLRDLAGALTGGETEVTVTEE